MRQTLDPFKVQKKVNEKEVVDQSKKNNSNSTDVIIVGAGLSGICAAHYLQDKCPGMTYHIFEARNAIGGTWDLFRYPGIRSDSDMFTLGYAFKPWKNPQAIADGPSILEYIKETAEESNIVDHIRYSHKVVSASWSSETCQWTVGVDDLSKDSEVFYQCKFLFLCSGYYDYEEGYTPEFKDVELFKGPVIHPQKWPNDFDYSQKKVVVIGSGATAVTIVPEMAKKASLVTMLQRSPTYIISVPDQDVIANFFRKVLPPRWAYALVRWKNILYSILFYAFSRKWPIGVKNFILKEIRKKLGPDYDVEKHFSPSYNPWDQRLCLVPNDDLFDSIKEGKTEMVTDQIDKFAEKGIITQSGELIEADVIVTATGLNLKVFGGIDVTVDGSLVKSSDLFCYRGSMFSSVPNLAFCFGYTNASWTLKCNLTCDYVCRLLNYMRKKGFEKCVPVMKEESLSTEPLLNLNSNYILRSQDDLPQQGSQMPWKLKQNYLYDLYIFKLSSFKDNALEFS